MTSRLGTGIWLILFFTVDVTSELSYRWGGSVGGQLKHKGLSQLIPWLFKTFLRIKNTLRNELFKRRNANRAKSTNPIEEYIFLGICHIFSSFWSIFAPNRTSPYLASAILLMLELLCNTVHI